MLVKSVKRNFGSRSILLLLKSKSSSESNPAKSVWGTILMLFLDMCTTISLTFPLKKCGGSCLILLFDMSSVCRFRSFTNKSPGTSSILFLCNRLKNISWTDSSHLLHLQVLQAAQIVEYAVRQVVQFVVKEVEFCQMRQHQKGVLVQGGQSVDPQITENTDCSCVTDAAPSYIETASCGRICVAGSTGRFCCQHDKLLVSGRHLQGPWAHSNHLSFSFEIFHTVGIELSRVIYDRGVLPGCSSDLSRRSSFNR